MADPIEKLLYSDNVGDDMPVINRNFSTLDDRTSPAPEDGYLVVQPWSDDSGIINAGITVGGGSDLTGVGHLRLRVIAANDAVVRRTGRSQFYASDGRFQLTWGVKGDAPTAGEEREAFFGFGDPTAPDLTTISEGIGFEYNPATLSDDNWRCVIYDGTTRYEVADTGIPYDGTLRRFQVEIPKDGSFIIFRSKAPSDAEWTVHYIEVDQGVIQAFGICLIHTKTAGAAGVTTDDMEVTAVTLRHEYLNA